jgi:hypothetical protein
LVRFQEDFFFDREIELDTANMVINQILKGSVVGVLVQGAVVAEKPVFWKNFKDD